MQVGGDAMRRRLVSLALALLAMLALASCGGASSPHPSPTSGIYGVTLVNHGGKETATWPTPSPLPGGFGLSKLEPYPRAVALIKVASGPDAGRTIARVRSDAQGVFRVALPPGRYLVRGSSSDSLRRRVAVRAGVYSRVRIQVASRF
jgi:hypothetical protein